MVFPSARFRICYLTRKHKNHQRTQKMLIKSVFIKKHNRLVLRLLQFLCVMSFDIDVEYLSRCAEANIVCHRGYNFSPLISILQLFPHRGNGNDKSCSATIALNLWDLNQNLDTGN